MAGIDESRKFLPVRIAVVTVSDTRTLETDTSGQTLIDRLTGAGHTLARRALVKDDIAAIIALLNELIASPNVDIVITTGGTGVTGRDTTPEAFDQVCEKKIDGFGELFRMLSFQKVGTSALQSRATAGVAKGKYLFAVPGSPGACKDAWDDILRFQLDSRHRPCNFVELIPRLKEGNPK
ncbi:MAG: molybdenum cofactor biosynthesis protein B [Alphaproteobacteria bacterium]|nr:molybdenum cofactor biosynthesis protein B [Alphaproteobacteria bacterium]